MAKTMGRVPNSTNSKKGNLRKCIENYRTLSLICHSSKIILIIILNRLNSQAEEVLSEEQAGFRKGRSITEQIFICRNLIEKHLEIQKYLYHNSILFFATMDTRRILIVSNSFLSYK